MSPAGRLRGGQRRLLRGFTDYAGNMREPTSVSYPTIRTSEARPTVQRVTGYPERTFAQWARDHAEDLRQ